MRSIFVALTALVALAACYVAPAPQAPVSDPEVVPSERGDGAEAGAPEAPPADERPVPPAAERPPEAEVVEAGTLAAGEACKTGQECKSGICEGEGCDVGVCASEQRACTRDLRPYCGCDGQTFRTSGSCPGRLYAYRGECQNTQ